MIAASLPQIRGHVGVASKTESVLTRLVERDVTLGALVLDAGVFCGDLTGHDQ